MSLGSPAIFVSVFIMSVIGQMLFEKYLAPMIKPPILVSTVVRDLLSKTPKTLVQLDNILIAPAPRGAYVTSTAPPNDVVAHCHVLSVAPALRDSPLY